ncbi:TonB-dependent receptor plug domain-containing protein [Gillisia sp. M10.2A]|uniref:TonB-dependent receptor plug domain-containing protein n=1 Tax=Gillisia lutea TaxID=2909668 RepID=A0ABS9EGV7_9FLAO|nr:M56 family metallopeptidase [Gillisia lutea]MCF4102043.1 TonB-dependent receptor plug domain-containing protein [Gillisia lutea]
MNDLLIYLAKSSFLISLFYGIYHFLLKKDITFNLNRRFLMSGIFAAAILPGIYFTKTVLIETPIQPLELSSVNYTDISTANMNSYFTWENVLLTIYLLGVGFMIIRFLLQTSSLLNLILGKDYHQDGNIKFVLTEKEIAPFSFMNYVVYNPDLHSETELDFILKHEKTHVRQWHTADILIANFHLIYQWFNPLAWLYIKGIQQNLEYIADNETASEVPASIKEYQKALIKVSTGNFNLALTNNFHQSFIKKRIVMLNNKSKQTNNSWKAALIFPVIIALMLSFNVKTLAQVKTSGNIEVVEVEYESNDLISVVVNKNTSEKTLKEYESEFEKAGIKLEFKNVKYSNEGQLTGIKVKYKHKTNEESGAYAVNDSKGIETFTITLNEDEKLNIQSATKHIKVTTNNSSTVFYKQDENENNDLLYIIDDEIVDAIAIDTLNPNIIKMVDVLKGKSATTKYGTKGKNGVVIVDLKPKNERTVKVIRAYSNNSSKVIFTSKDSLTWKTNKATKVIKLNKAEKGKAPEDTKTEIVFQNKNEKPLVVIDGQEQASDLIINTTSPQDIERVDVLKGDAATKKYGEKGMHGVIEITTKTKKE